mmetsp:Transcript_42143/g.134733  ORF Transcript_42143/g.134733 Transcript_42143/m.134733 type:complete len:458 (-) Transcript_42143:61-1434(-)
MVAASAEQAYTFASDPRPVQQRKKFREPEAPMMPSNIMFDRRVVRGNTYAAQILPAEPLTDSMGGTAGGTGKRSGRMIPKPMTPDPVEGRRHIDVQTDTYLEELTDIVPEVEISTQTDPFMDRPPTPLYIPKKTGVDAVTQIEPGDLFDFDFEVEPVLEVLVGKSLEQGLMEVMEEEELAAMRAHQEHFEQIRNAELVATQRMEAAEKRKLEEKERRLAQERERLDREKMVREKVAAATFARGYLQGLVSSVYSNLYDSGFFYDPVEKEVEKDFLPWLKDQVALQTAHEDVARGMVDKLVAAAVKIRSDVRTKGEAAKADEKSAAEAYSEKIGEAKNRYEEEAMQRVLDQAAFIITDMYPPVVSQEMVEALREELSKPPEPEVQPEAPPEPAEGEEPAEPVEPPPEPEPIEVTDEMILETLLDRGEVTMEQITSGLTLSALGDRAYHAQPSYVEPTQ